MQSITYRDAMTPDWNAWPRLREMATSLRPAPVRHEPVINFDTRRVGGVRFVKLGRLTLSFSVSRSYRPIGGFRD
jgi:hypothetical protein